jgi:small subunit ribosomal protein S18
MPQMKNTRGTDRRKRKRDEMQVRKRSRHLEGVTDININDVDFLKKFVTDHGKILPARSTGATAKQQRQIRAGVRRARTMGLLP